MTLQVNLFDSNFPNAPSSVMGKTPQYIEYVREQMEFSGITIFTDEWINSQTVDEVKSRIKVAWLHEPYCLHPQTYQRALRNIGKFDLLLTYYQPFLDAIDIATFVPYGGIWIPMDKWKGEPKTKMTSMLIGGKMSTDGHRIRHEIAARVDSLHGVYLDYFGVRGVPVDYSWETKYQVLAPYRFSVISETCREDNLFTEWLLDCLIMKTIPIFWGCPNVDKYFNPLGIFQFETAAQAEKVIKAALFEGEEMYYTLRNVIDQNFVLAQQYEITEDWMYHRVFRERGMIDAEVG